MAHTDVWPELAFAAWKDTHATLHLWLQIVGKIRLTHLPWINHSWHVTLYVTARGLSTLAVPHGTRSFEIDFDFLAHQLAIHSSDGGKRMLPLQAEPVAAFYAKLMEAMAALELPVNINCQPNELEYAIRFDEDHAHRSYDREYANRFWRVLLQADRVLKDFRARFVGKCSPVHFFFGNSDLAVTRFSGRRAPPHPGGRPHLPDWVLRDAYSQECCTCGFWPGGTESPHPVFFCEAYPQPPGFSQARVLPQAAHYSRELKEFVLPYDAVRQSASPDETLLQFLQSTYEAAANLGRWDREALESVRKRT
jgi:Family of unknown function (DUF5996)